MELTTERLNIRTLLPEDWKPLLRIADDFRASPYLIYDMPLPAEEDAIRELTARFAESGLFFAVFLKENPEMIGYICFHREADTYDLGYCFHSAYQGNGFAYEGCAALMGYLRDLHGDIRFTAGTALDNHPSCKLLERLGFALTDTETLSFHRDAAGNDIVFTGGRFETRPLSGCKV